jgi:hypothetical protein
MPSRRRHRKSSITIFFGASPEHYRSAAASASSIDRITRRCWWCEFLKTQRLPEKLIGGTIWQQRFADIAGFERHLAHNGTAICKFFLNVSKEEQKKRFLKRIEDPAKNWKFSMTDVAERARWDEYMAAYEDMIRNTSAPHAPWYVLPADHKWFTRLCVVGALIATLEKLDLAFPVLEESAMAQLSKARDMLMAE